ncbi:FAD-dependent oxidoreductase [Ktedonobacter sp. SOSP1-85]|uniref:NAD(P)/FAD-dependent oxidoreductase n=1 Tax=Ktedonobacter sp. SOSP1-85 TaxID=2778367 RepID=UPI0019152B73|nr:FAD-dependent oxidoreductase [Ktedonobacter sp. SOSP1-85]GHO81719.1 FAD-dependent oxidoreductase [Ktedonobacter sp. SOSP1-85]
MTSIAILGAGCSGLAAAHILQDAGWQVTLFEKSQDMGGRAATRSREGFIYDHGAQYIKRGAPASISWITGRFRTPDLIDIEKPVWVFNGQGEIQEGDAEQNAEEKWTYRSGLTTLAKQMARGLDIHLETRIDHVRQTPQGWWLTSEHGVEQGPFSRLLITFPLPQARELLQRSQLEPGLQEAIDTQLSVATYRPLLSIMLGYRPTPQRRPYYALVNIDKAHPISWLAWEHEKAPERVPSGAGLLIAQMAPDYSRAQWEREDSELVREGADMVVQLVQEEGLATPIFSDVQRWRYALPDQKADSEQLHTLTLPAGLAFCGDGFVGGRVHRALEHGIQVASLLAYATTLPDQQ